MLVKILKSKGACYGKLKAGFGGILLCGVYSAEPYFLQEANCTETGTQSATCSVCQAVFVTQILPKNDVYDPQETVIKAVICTANGDGDKICSCCNYQENICKKTGYAFGVADYCMALTRKEKTMKLAKRSLILALALVMTLGLLLTVAPTEAEAATRVGFWRDARNGEWFYYDQNGEVYKGWLQYGDDWYYFEENRGVMCTERRYIDGEYHDFNSDGIWLGVAKAGWEQVDGKWYYYDPFDGMLKDGIHFISGEYYCFDANGARVAGWWKENGYWYYFGDDGIRREGWLQLGEN